MEKVILSVAFKLVRLALIDAAPDTEAVIAPLVAVAKSSNKAILEAESTASLTFIFRAVPFWVLAAEAPALRVSAPVINLSRSSSNPAVRVMLLLEIPLSVLKVATSIASLIVIVRGSSASKNPVPVLNSAAAVESILTVAAVMVPLVTPFLITFNPFTSLAVSTVSVTLIFTVGSLPNTAASSVDTADPSAFAKSPMAPLIPWAKSIVAELCILAINAAASPTDTSSSKVKLILLLSDVRLVNVLSLFVISAAEIVRDPLIASTPPCPAPAAAVWSANFLISSRFVPEGFKVPRSTVIASFAVVVRRFTPATKCPFGSVSSAVTLPSASFIIAFNAVIFFAAVIASVVLPLSFKTIFSAVVWLLAAS